VEAFLRFENEGVTNGFGSLTEQRSPGSLYQKQQQPTSRFQREANSASPTVLGSDGTPRTQSSTSLRDPETAGNAFLACT